MTTDALAKLRPVEDDALDEFLANPQRVRGVYLHGQISQCATCLPIVGSRWSLVQEPFVAAIEALHAAHRVVEALKPLADDYSEAMRHGDRYPRDGYELQVRHRSERQEVSQ